MNYRARLIISTMLTLLTYFIIPPPDSLKIIISTLIGLSSYFLVNLPSSFKDTTSGSGDIKYQKIRPSPGTDFLLVSDYEKLKTLKGIPITIVDNGKDCVLVVNDENTTVFSFFFTESEEDLPSKDKKKVVVIPEEEAEPSLPAAPLD